MIFPKALYHRVRNVPLKVAKETYSNAILINKGEYMMLNVQYVSMTELEAGLGHIRQSPKDQGTLNMIVRRPSVDEREVLAEGELNTTEGLVGDTWKVRGNPHLSDSSAHRNRQITVMNARSIALLAQEKERWPLAGDQLYIDMDLSDENLPPGSRLAVGSAIIEVSVLPHNGCNKFSSRFGEEALNFVNSPEGKRLHLRGINTKVVQSGIIRVGDMVRKI
jgi:MOSC domain-containing protein YiiM